MEKETHKSKPIGITREVRITIPNTIMFLPERPIFERTILDSFTNKYGYDSPIEPNTKLFCSIKFKGTRTGRYALTDMANEVLKALETIAFDDKKNIETLLIQEDELFDVGIEVHIAPLIDIKNKVGI